MAGWIMMDTKISTTAKNKRVELYNIYPKKCNFCNSIIEYKNRHNKFCGHKCSINNQFKNKSIKYLERIEKCKQCDNLVIIKSNNNEKPLCKQCKQQNYKQKNYKHKRSYQYDYICKICETKFSHKFKKATCSKRCHSLLMSNIGKKGVLQRKKSKRSLNEIMFAELCAKEFSDAIFNEKIFNGWDADIIIPSLRIAILWNGNWHHKKLTKKHSLEQVQNRDRIKIKEIIKAEYMPYIINDYGKHNKSFVISEFDKFIKYLRVAGQNQGKFHKLS